MAAEHRARAGARIKEAREAKKWTQRELADRLPGKVDGPSVSRWERGEVYPEQYLEHLATVLEVDVSYFLTPAADKSNGTPDPFADTTPEDEDADLRTLLLAMRRELRDLRAEVRRLSPPGHGEQSDSA